MMMMTTTNAVACKVLSILFFLFAGRNCKLCIIFVNSVY